MAISIDISDEEIQLLNSNASVQDCVDYKGLPSNRFNSGRWRSAFLIMAVEVAERFAFYGITLNLITYLTGPLGQSTANGAASLNVWSMPRYYNCFCAINFGIIMTFTLGSNVQGGHKPCIQAFGADQFDSRNPEELKAKSSFFHWWFNSKGYDNSLSVKIGLAFCNTFRNQSISTSVAEFKLLDKESLSPRSLDQDFCSTNKVGEDKGIPRLFPIWATCLVFAIVYAQVFTLFTEQEVTMDESIGPNFKVPAASLLVFISLSTVILIPIYDRILVPFARAITGKPSGIMMLQRIGTGLVFSPLSMVIVAVFEMKHLETAQKYGLVNMLEAIVPMSIWWLIPQYLLFGIAEVFAYVGLQEFFYDKVPSGLRSTGLALYSSIFGIGSFLNSCLISTIEKASGGRGRSGWFLDNLNRVH
ncbi:NRT1 PTR FAMILY -like [Olea europaea subsp. europaea]|uniref:NRT1 PTR FAMILY -like n=1 Tax=Olea europaea subsp. europaea TaxID=158383 RepID=A0A8S0UI68_OLEEU|nr:NRT1 PTR FAMILY -like [Olea europaea subsp. europaea]